MRLAVTQTFSLWIWPSVKYDSTVVISRERYDSEFKALLDLLFWLIIHDLPCPPTRSRKAWSICLYGTPECPHLLKTIMTLFGHRPDERDIPQIDDRFDKTISAENRLSSTTSTSICCSLRASQDYWSVTDMVFQTLSRWEEMIWIRPTGVVADELRMPAVLVGNAAKPMRAVIENS